MGHTIRPALTLLYAIAGRVLSIEASDEWSANLISRFLREFYLDPLTVNPLAKASFSIKIFSRGPAPAIPEGLETFEVEFGHCRTDGETYYLTVEDSLIAAGINERGGFLSVWIGETIHARQTLSLFNLLAYVLEISLRRCGLYQLHGGGVVTQDGKAGVLIIGASGSGKSTLTAQLASRGWLYLTDDALLLTKEGDLVHARGIRRFFSASEATLASCSIGPVSPAVGGQMLSDPNKRRLKPLVAFPDRFISSCIPRTLILASITGQDRSEVQSTGRTDTMARLIRSNPWASYDNLTARDHLQILNRLTNQCRSYSLRAGFDILSDPSCAEALLMPLIEQEDSGRKLSLISNWKKASKA
ncbi:MAG: hypothetical protein AABN95_14375 [Acidobacteriota bacterium]